MTIETNSHSHLALTELFSDIDKSNTSINKIAGATGVSRVTLSKWNNGHSIPSLEKFLIVRKAVDAQLEQIQSEKS